MSYNYRVLNDNPRHFYPLASANYTDATGRSNGEVLGTPKTAPPLVVGGGNSMVFTGNDNFKFATGIFHDEDVIQPFTLEAWFKPVSVTETKGIVGHLSTLDGLTFDGEKISFTTLHGAAGAATASWFPPPTATSFHVLGVHSGEKNELYVNGVRVGTVSLTDEQLAVPYEIAAAPGYLYSGHHPGTIIVDSVAVYAHALTSRQAKLHFLWGRDAPDFRDVVSRRNGTYWDFTDQTSIPAFDFAFSTTDQWATGQSATVNIENDTIAPIIQDGASIEGTWLNGFSLGAIAATIDGSKIWWDGDGTFTIETSLNGTHWYAPVNGHEVPGISEGFASGNQALQVRVVFPAGQPEGTISKVRSLNIRLYNNRDVVGSLAEKVADIKGKATLAQEVHQPIEHHEGMGINFYSNGHAVIDTLADTRTLEFWVKANAAQAVDNWWHIFDYRLDGTQVGYVARSQPTANWSVSGGTLYVNGKQTATNADFEFTPGRWYHVIFVMNAASTNRLIINNNFVGDVGRPISVGMFAMYPTAFTAAEAASVYNEQMGIPAATFNEASGLTMTDPVNPTKLYSYSWSTIASG